MDKRHSLIVESLEQRNLLFSNGWDGVGQGSAELTYYIGDVPAEIDRAQFGETIDAAFAVWSEIADIKVRETSQPRQRDSLDIKFVSLDGAGDTLVQAYFPDDVNFGRIAGDVTFDADEAWEFGDEQRSAATDVLFVAIHEIGHALGLEHNEDDRSSVMFPTVSSRKTFTGLSQSDIDAILRLYAPSTVVTPGDFDLDGVVSVGDVDLLFGQFASGTKAPEFDLNADGDVDESDRDVLILDILDTTYGDANLDGIFDTADIVVVFQAGRYLDSSVGGANWSSGDWTGDGVFDFEDIVLAFQQGGYTA